MGGRAFSPSARELAIDLSAVADSDDEHDELVLDHFINDPVHTDSESPKTGELALQRSAGRWSFSQSIDRIYDPNSFLAGKPTQGFCRAGLNLH